MKTIAILFIRSLVIFSVLLLGYSLFFIGWGEMELIRMVLIPASAISAFLILIHIVISRIEGVRENFLAQQSLEIDSNETLEEIGKKIKLQLKWRQVKNEENQIEYVSSFTSLKSFGEKINLSKEGKKIVVTSKPLLSSTIFDFGKNYQNLIKVKSLI